MTSAMLINDDHVGFAPFDIFDQALQSLALRASARVSTVIVAIGQKPPAILALTLDKASQDSPFSDRKTVA